LYISSTALDWLTLACLPGIGSTTLCRLAQRYDTPTAILTEIEHDSDINPRLVRILTDQKSRREAEIRAEQQLNRLEHLQISLTCHGDPFYPQQLNFLADAPVLLFFQGDLSCLQSPSVALVGSRAATSYGRDVSYKLAAGLVRQGVVVVSGVALGIDARAHQGALAAGGMTAGVLGCGLDVVYPRGNRNLYPQIADQGVLLSEYPCGTRPDGFRFPARNRIISGLVQGVVIVEATLKSGSLITARLALDQGREVFAVPGRIDSAKSSGTHRLIKQGAHLVQSIDDIIGELGIGRSEPTLPAASLATGSVESTGEQLILNCLDVYPTDIDTILRVTALEAGQILDFLLQLELKGLVRQLPGQMYEKIAID
jgi:DNA processing protein